MTETIYYAIRTCEHKDENYTWSNADSTADATTYGAKSPIDALLSWDTVSPIIITFCFTVCEPSVLTDNIPNIYFLEINGIKLCVLLDKSYNDFAGTTKYLLVDIKNAFQQNATAATATTATVTADELQDRVKTSIEEHLRNNKNVTQEGLQDRVKTSIEELLKNNQNVTQEELENKVKDEIELYLEGQQLLTGVNAIQAAALGQNLTQKELETKIKNSIEAYLKPRATSGGSKSNLRSPYNFTKLARNEKNKHVYYVYV